MTKKLRRILSKVTLFTFIFYQFLPLLYLPLQVNAQEIIESPTPVPTLVETITPTESAPSPTETTTPVETLTPTDTPVTATATSAPTDSPSNTPTAVEIPTETQTPTIVSVSPTVTTATGGELDAIVVDHKSADSIENLELTPQEVTSNPTLATDKADYAPTDAAIITGTGFAKNTTYTIYITAGSYSFTDTFTTNELGEFVYTYQLDGVYRPLYFVEIKLGDTLIAKTSFTDAAVQIYDQCSNDDGDGYASGDTGCRWTNGNLQSNNSTYYEGESTVQRVYIDGLVPGTNHTVTFQYGTTKGGKHAYDYLTTWDQSEDWIALADRCQDIAGCTTAGEDNSPQIPNDANVPDTIEPSTDRYFTIRGGSIDTAPSVPGIISGDYAGDSETSITVNFTVANSGSMCTTNNKGVTTCGVVIWFGAHISETPQWFEYNGTSGATTISGSPYHVALSQFNGVAVGQRDNQMQANAIFVPQTGHIIVDKVTVPAGDSQSFSFITTGTGYNGFSLTDTAAPNDQTLNAGTYSVSEAVPSGWTQTSATCTDGQTSYNPSNLTLSAGQTITCTFTNTKKSHLIVQKTTLPSGDTTEFTINASGNGTITGGGTGVVTDALDKDYEVTPGTYSVSETVPSGWDKTADTCQNVTIAAGETKYCQLTNTKQGTIIVKKVMVGGTDEFNFTGDVAGAIAANNGTLQLSNIAPGTYTTTESAKSGWNLTSLTCDDPASATASSGSLATRTATFKLDPGETVTCTFTNTKNGKIIVDKITYPSGSSQSFNFTAGGTGYNNFSLTDTAAANEQSLVPGTYSLLEQEVTGWTAGEAVCSDGSPINAITVAAGEIVTCTFKNVKNPLISIVQSATNIINEEHTFTVKVGQFDGNFQGLFGFKPTVTFTPSPVIVQDNCATTGTDINGQCTVVFNSTIAGIYTAQAALSLTIGGVNFNISTDGSGENSGNAVKTYVDGRILLSPLTAVNDIHDPHEIVATVYENPGSGEVPAAGELVTFTLPTNSANAAFVGGVNTCTTGSNGQCSVFINASQPGQVIIHAAVSIAVDGKNVARFSGDTYGSSADAAKTYQAGRIIVVKQTLPDGSTQSFEFNSGWSNDNFSLSDGQQSDSGYLVPGTYSVSEINIPADWTLTNTVCTDGSSVDNINLSPGEIVTCTFTNTFTPPLSVVKTAATTFTRTFNWSIDKSVDRPIVNMFQGDSSDVQYTVDIVKTGYTDSNWQASGNITIHNSAAVAANITDISDVISDDINAAVVCPVTLPYSLAAGGNLECTYSTNLPDASIRTNTATVSTTGLVAGNSGTAAVVFGSPTFLVNDTIYVDDTNGSSWQFSNPGSVSYNRNFSCNSDEGQYDNTATIRQTGQNDSADVTVNCYDLTVTKNAATSYDRTYGWNIDKSADRSTVTLSPDQVLPVNYTVEVNTTGSVNSNFAASGTIVISNPAPITATINSVSDILSGGKTANVDCGGISYPYQLSAGGTLNCTYQVGLDNASSLTNTATAVLQNYPSGTTSFTGSAAVSFATATITDIDECIDVTDSLGGTLGTVCQDAAPKSFTYSYNIGPYQRALCGVPQNVDNTASFVANDTGATGSDTWRVTANVACVCSLTQGYWKTHNGSFNGGKHTDPTWSLLGFLKENTIFFNSGQTWFQVFQTPVGGNAYYILAHQYMAAKLNNLKGASGPGISTALTQAEALFTSYTPAQIAALKGKNGNSIRSQFINLAGILGAFNEGLTNPAGHCSEVQEL